MSSGDDYRREQDKLFKNLGLPGERGSSDDELIEGLASIYLSQHETEVTDVRAVEEWALDCLMRLKYGKARSEALAPKIRRRVVWNDYRRRKQGP